MQHLTIRDIAKMAGVSVTTVSRALNDAHDINPETKNRILALCKEHGWYANELARSLSTNRSHLIGIILPDLTNSYYNTMALYAERRARELGYAVLLCSAHSNSPELQELFDFMISQHVDGILTHTIRERSYADLMERNLPFVLIGQNTPEYSSMRVNSVYCDNYIGGKRAAEYLLSLGHKKMLYVGLRENSHTHDVRYKGFCDAVEAAGGEVETICNHCPNSTLESGYQMGIEYFTKEFDATAAFAVSDLVAVGFLQAADESGIEIPKRLSLLGYDNLEFCALPNIQLTSMAQPLNQIAMAGVDALIACIDRDNNETFVQTVVLPQLIERKSCIPYQAK